MFRFEISLHARPAGLAFGEPVEIEGHWVRPLRVDPTALAEPLPVRFEDAVEAMQQLPRMFVEPDGSFVWVSSDNGGRAWQLDGLLSDRNDRLLRVDLKGSCTAEAFDVLRAIVCGARTGGAEAKPVELLVQLTRSALFLDEATFRRIAALQH